jgi:hypothetical protein
VKPEIAHRIASQSHAGQRNRFGDPVIRHVERVAAAVPADARATALLHDLFELCPRAVGRLRARGLSQTQLEALELLTHGPDDSYEVYVCRIADAPGPPGRLARIVKLADLEDHLAHRSIPADAPPYEWARRQLLSACAQANHAASLTPRRTRQAAKSHTDAVSSPRRRGARRPTTHGIGGPA